MFVWRLVFGVVCLKELFEHIEPLKPFEPYVQILEVKIVRKHSAKIQNLLIYSYFDKYIFSHLQ